MPRRRRLPPLRWSALGLAAALTLGAALSPWWEAGITGTTWQAVLGNGGLRVWWLTGGRTWQPSGLDVIINGATPRPFLGWWPRCHPYVWVPNAWLPAWVIVAPTWVAAAALWRSRPARTRRGHCPACGYDVSAIPSRAGTVTCPECGGTSPVP